MQTLIYRKPGFQFPPHNIPSNFFSSKTRRNHHNNVSPIHQKESHYTLKTLKVCSFAAPQSLIYGGWDESQLTEDSVNSGESYQFYNLLSSIGIGDKKYVYVYLFGFVCALAFSRVKISTIMIFPASAIVFALGFSVGLVKGGHMKESKLNEIRKKVIDDNCRGLIEKLGNLGEIWKGYNAEVLNLKNGIRRSIERNEVTRSDLEGYIDVLETTDINLGNTIDLVKTCVQILLGGYKENGIISDHDSNKRRKKSVHSGFSFSHYFDGLFGWKFDGPRPGKVQSYSKKELNDVDERKNKKLANILAAPVQKVDLNSARDGDSEKKGQRMLDNTVRAENLVDGSRMENISVENETIGADEISDTTEAFFNQTIYNHRNKTSKFSDNQKFHFKDFQDEIKTMSSPSNSYNSLDVSISMNRTASSIGHQQKRETLNRNYWHLENTQENQQKRETLNRNYWHLENTQENQQEYYSYTQRPPFSNQESSHESVFDPYQSSTLGHDAEFSRCLSEANNLLKEAKGCLTKQVDDIRAEHALQKSAVLLSKAIEVRPMSLLAVGQLGNTYLLHGELKLKMSRDLRSLLERTDPLLNEEWGEILKKFDDQFNNKDEITSALVNICEECEELLIKAGRKYKLALSIDGNDMRALYNWGLALTFRAELIADIGPSAARDADKIFLAAIDKFDAMMSKSNAYAPDALFRWGAALQHRSRLRPSRSREKVKLLQQARRLYEDALVMDSGNRPLQEALSSCMSELDYLYR